jgi:hypothetical protein
MNTSPGLRCLMAARSGLLRQLHRRSHRSKSKLRFPRLERLSFGSSVWRCAAQVCGSDFTASNRHKRLAAPSFQPSNGLAIMPARFVLNEAACASLIRKCDSKHSSNHHEGARNSSCARCVGSSDPPDSKNGKGRSFSQIIGQISDKGLETAFPLVILNQLDLIACND